MVGEDRRYSRGVSDLLSSRRRSVGERERELVVRSRVWGCEVGGGNGGRETLISCEYQEERRLGREEECAV